MPFEVWCANIAPKLKNIQNTQRKQVFFDSFVSILIIVPFGGNISAKTKRFFVKRKSDFLTPQGPLGAFPYTFEQK